MRICNGASRAWCPAGVCAAGAAAGVVQHQGGAGGAVLQAQPAPGAPGGARCSASRFCTHSGARLVPPPFKQPLSRVRAVGMERKQLLSWHTEVAAADLTADEKRSINNPAIAPAGDCGAAQRAAGAAAAGGGRGVPAAGGRAAVGPVPAAAPVPRHRGGAQQGPVQPAQVRLSFCFAISSVQLDAQRMSGCSCAGPAATTRWCHGPERSLRLSRQRS